MTASYATEEQLAAWLEGTPYDVPENPDRVLARASEVIADWTAAVVVDDDGVPVDDVVLGAFAAATCAQVEQWEEVGEENDVAGYPQGTTMALGAGATTGLPTILAPRAARILRRAGVAVTAPGQAADSPALSVELV